MSAFDRLTRAADRLGLLAALEGRGAGGGILFYHGVIETLDDPRVQRLHLPESEFAAHLAWLDRRHHFIGADELSAALRGETRLDPGWVFITFDDGYANNHQLVADSMGQRPWACYVSTAHIDDGHRVMSYRVRRTVFHAPGPRLAVPSLGLDLSLADDARDRTAALLVRRLKHAPRAVHDIAIEEVEAALSPDRRAELDARFDSDTLMTWDQVRALAAAGVHIGGHAHEHQLLHPGQAPAEVQAQIEQSAARLTAELGTAPTSFAYPNGGAEDLSAAAWRALVASPYQWALTTIPGGCAPDSQPPYLLPRIAAGTLAAVQRGLTRRRWDAARTARMLATLAATVEA